MIPPFKRAFEIASDRIIRDETKDRFHIVATQHPQVWPGYVDEIILKDEIDGTFWASTLRYGEDEGVDDGQYLTWYEMTATTVTAYKKKI